MVEVETGESEDNTKKRKIDGLDSTSALSASAGAATSAGGSDDAAASTLMDWNCAFGSDWFLASNRGAYLTFDELKALALASKDGCRTVQKYVSSLPADIKQFIRACYSGGFKYEEERSEYKDVWLPDERADETCEIVARGKTIMRMRVARVATKKTK